MEVDALADFSHSQIKDEPGVAPWRAAIAAELGDWRKANDGFTGTEQGAAEEITTDSCGNWYRSRTFSGNCSRRSIIRALRLASGADSNR